LPIFGSVISLDISETCMSVDTSEDLQKIWYILLLGSQIQKSRFCTYPSKTF
jgi:hypothetical protein